MEGWCCAYVQEDLNIVKLKGVIDGKRIEARRFIIK